MFHAYLTLNPRVVQVLTTRINLYKIRNDIINSDVNRMAKGGRLGLADLGQIKNSDFNVLRHKVNLGPFIDFFNFLQPNELLKPF